MKVIIWALLLCGFLAVNFAQAVDNEAVNDVEEAIEGDGVSDLLSDDLDGNELEDNEDAIAEDDDEELEDDGEDDGDDALFDELEDFEDDDEIDERSLESDPSFLFHRGRFPYYRRPYGFGYGLGMGMPFFDEESDAMNDGDISDDKMKMKMKLLRRRRPFCRPRCRCTRPSWCKPRGYKKQALFRRMRYQRLRSYWMRMMLRGRLTAMPLPY